MVDLPIRYTSKDNELHCVDHPVKLEDARHNEERFFFGICPVSLKTSSSKEKPSDASTELKVISLYFCE